ncbi:unnamed protein product [Lasius platythorax]|uniref:non-specific serine/threonine protein kinase n=2 Tax=Lasius TaxID=488720 RepID=A0A0J7KHP2_LASNI|nr:eukaryotic translation initiation factor 2-alpha kinase 1-like protein [Lasius niger]
MAENTEQTNHPWNTLTTVTTFDQVLCDNLHKLQIIDGSYSTIEFEILRTKYQRALYQLINIARSKNGSESIPLNIPSCLSEVSRYRREFQEIDFIAGGAFGDVYKAQHRLDGIDYAIKKTSVKSSDHADTLKQYLNEVKALAKLNHANIVSYKAAWIETLSSYFIPSHTSDYTEQSQSYNLQFTKDSYSNGSRPSYLNDNNWQDMSLDKETTYAAGKQTVEEASSAKHIEETFSDIVSFRNSKKSKKLSQTIEDSTNRTDYNYLSVGQEICSYTSNEYMTLYIQMSLCEQTLEQWMRGRRNASPEPVIRAILQQILCGIDYMHSQNVVHHDIKPSNIFISTSGQLQIQLGDFGLACPLKPRGAIHSACGTISYAAPEQLQGKCDPKSDIYSVGIVLVELSIPTQTQMELSSITQSLKRGKIPTSFATERPKWAQMIIQMVQEDPIKRPCTKQLLQNLKEDEDVTLITELKDTVVILKNHIRDKDNTIQELQEEIALLKKEVEKLKDPPEDAIK